LGSMCWQMDEEEMNENHLRSHGLDVLDPLEMPQVTKTDKARKGGVICQKGKFDRMRSRKAWRTVCKRL